MPIIQTRRHFLTALSLAGAAGLLRAPPTLAADGPVEMTSVRIPKLANICGAPQYVVEDLLRAEGFDDIRYIELASSAETSPALANGKVDFSSNYASSLIAGIDGGGAIMVVAGVHVGCLELFGNEGIRTVTDLRGKSVGVPGLGSSAHMFVSLMAAFVGLDPVKDIRWVASQFPGPIELFVEGKVDAILAARPLRKTSERGKSATWPSTRQSTAHGRSISAACWRATGSSCGNIRSPLRPCCAPFSKPRISAPPSRHVSRGRSSRAASRLGMIMPSRR
jgi:ABC-type nitrate/sulfonate/bicarbonate transport system substrate-binding protein